MLLRGIRESWSPSYPATSPSASQGRAIFNHLIFKILVAPPSSTRSALNPSHPTMTDSSYHHQDDPHTLQHHPRPPDDSATPTASSPHWPRPLQASIARPQPHPLPSLPSLSKVLNPSPTPFMSTVGGSSSYAGRSYSGSVEPCARVSELLSRLELSEYFRASLPLKLDSAPVLRPSPRAESMSGW